MNSVWRVDELIVRICTVGDRTRFLREARLGASLPLELGYPRVIGAGLDEDMSWTVTVAVQGSRLADELLAMDADERRAAGHRLGELLAAFHAVAPPAGIDERVLGHPKWYDAIPLPVSRARRLLEHARPGIGDDLADSVARRIDELGEHDPFGDPVSRVLLHGDFSPDNVVWRNGRPVAVIDLEWARTGLAHADLFWLAFGDRDVLAGVADAYPNAFVPGVERALRLCLLAFQLRSVADGHKQPESRQARRLRALVDEPVEPLL